MITSAPGIWLRFVPNRTAPQEEVAHAMAVRQPRVSAIERGKLDVVTLATLRAYVRASAEASGSWQTSATGSTD
jgi:predicted XRE-type DNA-binding protein